MKIRNFAQAQGFLRKHIPKSLQEAFQGGIGLKRIKYFLKLIGDPQEKIKVIHIAGTSGKGSTVFFLSNILTEMGFRAGRQVSPHFKDVRERLCIDNKLVSKKQFCEYLDYFIPLLDKMEKTKYGRPTYFELLVALAYYHFYKNKVDYAIIETGLGGLYDGTNCVENKDKLVVLTKIGLDHTRILGETIGEIAFQKAMITQKENTVVSIEQKSEANKVIKKVIKKQKGNLIYVQPKKNFDNIKCNSKFTEFDFEFDKYRFEKLKTGAKGIFQAENCSLALTSTILLSQRDGFNIDEKKLRKSLQKINIPARMEIIDFGNKKIIMDGAHNPQKMKALAESLKKIFPNQKFDFLIAMKRVKDLEGILKNIVPTANKIIITNLLNKTQTTAEPKVIKKLLKKTGFENTEIVLEQEVLLKKILKSQNTVVITGSLYLVSEIHTPLLKMTKAKK